MAYNASYQTAPPQSQQQVYHGSAGYSSATTPSEGGYPAPPSSEQPLPPGWSKEWNHQYNAWFYINAQVNPVITQWTHPSQNQPPQVHPSQYVPPLGPPNTSYRNYGAPLMPQANSPPGYTTTSTLNGIPTLVNNEKGGSNNYQPSSGVPQAERNGSYGNSYGPPPSGPPSNQYGAPSNGPPTNQYGPPPNGPPPNQYSPHPNGPPSNQYGAPPNGPPSNQYGPPPSGPPPNQYGPPPSGPPPNQYGPPPSGPPPNQYAAPPTNHYGTSPSQPLQPGSQYPTGGYDISNQKVTSTSKPSVTNKVNGKKPKTGLFGAGLGALGGLALGAFASHEWNQHEKKRRKKRRRSI